VAGGNAGEERKKHLDRSWIVGVEHGSVPLEERVCILLLNIRISQSTDG
jgi:hypothetical protein